MITLEFSEQEITVLLLIFKLGLDLYICEPGDNAEVLEALAHAPNPLIDGIIAKLSRAGTAALKGKS